MIPPSVLISTEFRRRICGTCGLVWKTDAAVRGRIITRHCPRCIANLPTASDDDLVALILAETPGKERRRCRKPKPRPRMTTQPRARSSARAPST